MEQFGTSTYKFEQNLDIRATNHNLGSLIDNSRLLIGNSGLLIDNSGLLIDNTGLLIDNSGCLNKFEHNRDIRATSYRLLFRIVD